MLSTSCAVARIKADVGKNRHYFAFSAVQSSIISQGIVLVDAPPHIFREQLSPIIAPSIKECVGVLVSQERMLSDRKKKHCCWKLKDLTTTWSLFEVE
jgi:hypothetical protein